ncbi:MAG: hypothetical protein E3J65_06785 [Dehalococcoidia bacterium]|nr:MAG: hypothetical protein E3J65_06785 [Dehalococcoidia bacterium]
MRGPFLLNSRTIDLRVKRTAPGTYKASNSKTAVKYVGRSDSNLNAELKTHVNRYKYFWYEYATSLKAAFEKECSLYHYHGGAQGKLDNKNHPGRPAGYHWKCPRCSMFD